MRLYLIKTMNHTAFEFAISHDKTKFATSSDRMVRVYSWPELKVIEKFRLSNVSSMVFLEDNCSILLLNTTGKLFLWDGKVLHKQGKWPVRDWIEKPLVYYKKNYILWAGEDGIWKYNADTREIERIYSSHGDNNMVCSCQNGKIYGVCGDYKPDVPQKLRFVEIDEQGDYTESETEMLTFRDFEYPAKEAEGKIALSATEPILPITESCPSTPFIYLFNHRAQILKRQELSEFESGTFYYGNGMFVLKCSLKDCFIFYDATNLEEIYRLNREFICAESRYNRPEAVAFMKDKYILIGCLEKMYVFRIEE